MKNKEFWKSWANAAGIRSLKTMAQTAVAMIPVGTSIANIGWREILLTSMLAGLASLLTSLAGLPEIKES